MLCFFSNQTDPRSAISLALTCGLIHKTIFGSQLLYNTSVFMHMVIALMVFYALLFIRTKHTSYMLNGHVTNRIAA